MGKAVREQRRAEQRAQREAAAREDVMAVWERVFDGATPLQQLYAVRQARLLLDDHEPRLVEMLRSAGVPWAEVGRALGVTGQAVSRRYGGLGVVRG